MDPVTLIAPDGGQYVTSDPVEANNLQFAHGYRIKQAEQPAQEPVPPPQSGAGSGKERWVDYAGQVGVPIDPDASRDDTIATVRKAGKPVE